MEITCTFFNSPLGIISIGADDESIIAVLFVNSLKGTQADENKITITEPQQLLLKICVQQLQEYFDGSRKDFDLPIKHEGSAFQQKVWEALIHIDYGKTISYLELSKRINNVKAIRAVGTCNGSNKISIIVPCHRVIGSNGSLTGYGGGLWRKKWLLEHEAKFAHGVQTLF